MIYDYTFVNKIYWFTCISIIQFLKLINSSFFIGAKNEDESVCHPNPCVNPNPYTIIGLTRKSNSTRQTHVSIHQCRLEKIHRSSDRLN